MSYYTATEIFTELESTPGSNDKIAILTREVDNVELKNIIRMALDPFVTYGIKKIPEYTAERYGAISLTKALANIERDIVGTQRSQKTMAALIKILCQVDEGEANILERVIAKDLKCGVSISTVNKIWPGLIPVFTVMLAEKTTNKTLSNINFPAYVQRKFDGMRVNVVIQANGNYQVFSRNGKPVETFALFEGIAPRFANCVLDGELLCIDADGKYLDRKTSNGICNKAMAYSVRLKFLQDQFAKGVDDTVLRLASTMTVNTMEEVYDIFAKELASGEEGIILKNIDAQWQPKRSKDMIKFKAENTADLVVVDVTEGTGRLMGKLGAFLCQTSDGLLEVSVGTGFSDEQREEYFSKNYIGSVIETTYNEQIQAKGKKLPSLFLPVFQSMRADKSVANTLEELV